MGAPDVLMSLQLKANGQVIFEYPGCQIPGWKLVMRRREQNGVRPIPQSLNKEIPAPFVVFPGCDHELVLVMWRCQVEVFSLERIPLATAWSLDVNDLDDGLRDTFYAHMTTRFQHHRIAVCQQDIHQRVYLFLLE